MNLSGSQTENLEGVLGEFQESEYKFSDIVIAILKQNRNINADLASLCRKVRRVMIPCKNILNKCDECDNSFATISGM